MVLGFLMMGEPFVATFALMQVLGGLLVLAGVFEFAGSFWGRQWGGFFHYLLAGVLYLVVGVLMIGKTDEAAAAFTLLVACSLLVGGVFRIVLSASSTSTAGPGFC